MLSMVAALLVATAPGTHEWTRTDLTLQATYVALHVADWGQTRYIARDPRFDEVNPVLGRRPTAARVNLYFAGTLAAETAVSAALPRGPRRVFLVALIALEAYWVSHNRAAGVGFAF